MIGFVGTSLQLESITTAHNQWLSATRSIHCWTASVFSSTVTNGERRNHCSHIELPWTTSVWRITPTSRVLMLRPTISRPVCLGVKHPSGAYDQIFSTVRQLRLCWCEALSLPRGWVCRLQLYTGPRQRRHFRVRVPWDSWSYFTVSDSRLPFLSPRTIRRATVEVFDPASTRERLTPTSQSELLYDWRFTANQFVLTPSPLRLTARIFFLNWTPAVIVLI
jgi:hypothetical protein